MEIEAKGFLPNETILIGPFYQGTFVITNLTVSDKILIVIFWKFET